MKSVEAYDAESFDLASYYQSFPKGALETPEGRRALSHDDPLAFALIYFPHHLRNAFGKITFGDHHFEWCALASEWVSRNPSRDAIISPRNAGKTTWWFLILPMWAAAFGYIKYAVGFASRADQAQKHLSSFRSELDNNKMLREDFPPLCEPAKRANGRDVANNEHMFKAVSGFRIEAYGVDSAVAGLKDGENRPDLLLLDDIEPDKSNYSVGEAAKRLHTITQNLFLLNEDARVVISGTTTMEDSIVHQITKSLVGIVPEWMEDLTFPITVHHQLPIVTRPDGTERSYWPGRYTLEYFLKFRGTPNYLLNYMNDPSGGSQHYWQAEDFVYGNLEAATITVLALDPAIETKARSDFTGMAVVAFSPSERKLEVVDVLQVKLAPPDLYAKVLDVLRLYPQIRGVVMEVNQGASLWRQVFGALPVPLLTRHNNLGKEVRFAKALDWYRSGFVLHGKQFAELESQMRAFPNVVHDDLPDAVVLALEWLMKKIATSSKVRTSKVTNMPSSWL